MKKTMTFALSVLTTAVFGSSASADCGEVTIAEMNWASASIFAHIDQYILNHGYGCHAELVTGDTMPTTTSMVEKAEPDVAPEMWINSIKEVLDQGVADGKIEYAGRIFEDGGEEGWWIPKYMVDENPELATISGVKAHPELFPNPEDPSRGLVMNCPSGWNCQILNDNLFRGFGMDTAGFDLGDPGSSAGLDGSLAKAYERGEGWLGYYWAPTAFLGKFDMVKVDFETGHDTATWESCIQVEGCTNPQPNAWRPSEVHTVTSKEFADEAPEAYEYLKSRSVTNAFLNKFLLWAEENQVGGPEATEYFLANHADIWTAWVDEDVADKIRASMQ